MITNYMRTSSSNYFVLTDPDTPLDSAPGDILFVYQFILNGLSLYNVGASIRWDDWHERFRDNQGHYEDAFIHSIPKVYEYRSVNYYYIEAAIDTTFALYKKGVPLRRVGGPSIRMLPPLGVRHLDFYLGERDAPEDVLYYESEALTNRVNHFSHVKPMDNN